MRHVSIHLLHLRSLHRSTLSSLALLLLLIPLVFGPPDVKSLPPVTATVQRVAPPTVTHAHGTPLLDRVPQPATQAASALFRLRQTSLPTPGRTRHVSFHSAALDRTMNYWIYLPPGYDSSTARFPVLYMLHGLGGSSFQWKTMGLFNAADELIRTQQIVPLMIVTPQGDNGYWMNHADAGPRYGDYVVQDLLPHIDTTYRTIPNVTQRAIGGLSMGGHGAIQLALNNPGVFGVVGGHSPVFRTETEAFPFFGKGADYQQRDPVSLVQDLHVGVPFRLWMDMGDQDMWLPRTAFFSQVLDQRGFLHEWHLNPGDHHSSYWSPQIPTYLKWYDHALRSATP